MTCGRLLQLKAFPVAASLGKTVGAHAVLSATGVNSQTGGVLTQSRQSVLHLLEIKRK